MASAKRKSTPAELLVLEDFLPYRLSILSNRVSRAIAARYAEKFNLTIPEWRIIAVLGRRPGLTAKEIAEATEMDKVAVSRAVSALLAQKFLTRQTDPNDARRSSLTLSSKGYAVFDQVVPLALAYERRILSHLEPKEQSHLLAILDKLEAAELAEKL